MKGVVVGAIVIYGGGFIKSRFFKGTDDCMKITFDERRNACLAQIALEKNDVSVCKMTSPPWKCQLKVALDAKRPIPCQELPDHERFGGILKAICEINSAGTEEAKSSICKQLAAADRPYEYLLSKCFEFDVDWISPSSGNSSLMTLLDTLKELALIYPKHDELFVSLIAHKANLTLTNKDGNNALHLAARIGYITPLMNSGLKLDVNAPNREGLRPIDILIESGHARMREDAKKLIEAGANVDLTDLHGISTRQRLHDHHVSGF